MNKDNMLEDEQPLTEIKCLINLEDLNKNDLLNQIVWNLHNSHNCYSKGQIMQLQAAINQYQGAANRKD